jgi:hypothetical protein
MSRITLAPNASGTGTLTVAAPNTNTDRTLTLPDVTTTLVGTDATQTLTNKSIAASQLTGALPAIDGSALTGLPAPAKLSTASGSAPSYSARAWVNFNGTGTVAIRASGNVTSITDNGTGNYTVNFTTAMPDANYTAPANVSVSGAINYAYSVDVFSLSTTSCSLGTGYFSGSSNIPTDVAALYLAVFR